MTHPLCPRQSLHEVGISLLERYTSDKDYNFFFSLTLNLLKRPWVKIIVPSGYKQ